MPSKDEAMRTAVRAAQLNRPALPQNIYQAPAIVRQPAVAVFNQTKAAKSK